MTNAPQLTDSESRSRYALRRRLRFVGLFLGLVLDAIVVFVPVSSEVCRDLVRKTFGILFCGVPSEASVGLLAGILFTPLIFVCPQFMILLGQGMGLYDIAELRRAWWVVIAGGIYFLALIAACGIYLSLHGV